jgi:hypothetical protein
MIEFDAVVQRDLDTMAEEALQRRIDLIAFPGGQKIDEWGWTFTLDGLWRRDEMRNQLLCVSGFSERAVSHLLTVRREHAARAERGELQQWPFCEGFVPTALHVAGFRIENLSRFGAIDCYEWWPPYHETELPGLAEQSFIHPVLIGQRYVTSLLYFPNTAERYLNDPESRWKFDLEPPEIVLPAVMAALARDRGN